jgi:glucose-6-phosphate isomerase
MVHPNKQNMENFCQIGKLHSKKISELSSVLRDPFFSPEQDGVAYDVCRGENKKVTPLGELQYDLTKIYPEEISGELHKTAGHYHSEGYTELFEVIEGELITLLQMDGKDGEITEAYAVKAGSGDKVIIPPNYGFCSINHSSNKELIMSNWIDTKAQNMYENIEKNRGLCYYIVNTEKEKNSPIKNPAYKKVPELIWLKPKALPQELENLEFLSSPQNYTQFLTIEALYEKI